MNRLFKTFIFVVVFFGFAQSACMANVLLADQFNIGGITMTSTPSYVKSIYGEPTKSRNVGGPYGNGIIYEYGNSFTIRFTVPGPTVTDIDVTADNGISTIAGIHVGSDMMDVRKAYGQPRLITVDKQTKKTRYLYLMKDSGHITLYFIFDTDWKVSSFGFALMDGPSLAE